MLLGDHGPLLFFCRKNYHVLFVTTSIATWGRTKPHIKYALITGNYSYEHEQKLNPKNHAHIMPGRGV
jgi:hypothetical protein